MGDNKQNDINAMLGELRASVDKPAKTTKKTAGNDVFDREIAALIQKQLDSNVNSTQVSDDVTDVESTSFYSDEIKLEDFVIDDAGEETKPDFVELEEIVEAEPELESIELEEIVEAEPEFESIELEKIIEDESAGLEEPIDYDEQSEEMPPAIMQALEDAFAIDEEDVPEQVVEQEIIVDDEVLREELSIEDEVAPVESEALVEEEPVVATDDIFNNDIVSEYDAIARDDAMVEDYEIIEDVPMLENEEISEDVSISEQEQALNVADSVDIQTSQVEVEAVDDQCVPLSDNDITMMLSLGQESDLGERMGYENLDEYKKNLREAQAIEPEDKLDLPDAYAYRGVEYKSHAQDEQIMDDYNKCRAVAIIKLIVGVVICGLCGFMENARYFGFWLLEPFEPVENPGVFALTMTGLLLGAALLCLRQLKNGIISVVKMSPEPHAMTFFAASAALVCNIVMIIIRPENVMTYNFPATLFIVVTLMSELISICREMNSFSVVSAEGVRYSPEREARMFEEKYNSRASAKIGGQNRRVYNIVSSRFSDGYFRRTNEKKKGIYILNFMLLPTIAVAFVELVIALSIKESFATAMGIFAATFMVIMPLPLIIALTVPQLVASVRLKKQRSAILGDSAVDEFSRPKLLAFEDRDMFPADNIGTKGLKLYDGFEIYDVLIKTGSLFAYIGGPLGELFEAENSQYHRIRDIKLVKVDRGGVEAVLDGKVNILAGKIEFIEKYGIYPKRTPRDEQLAAEGVVSIIYIVIDSKPAARLYSDYRTDADFERSICELCRFGDAAAIRTSDPGIDEAMINRKRTKSDYELSVIRPGYARDGQEKDTFDGGIVCLDNARGIVEAINECHKIKKSRDVSMILYFFAYLMGIMSMTVLVILKLSAYIASGLVAAYLLLWLLPVLFLPAIFDISKKK